MHVTGSPSDDLQRGDSSPTSAGSREGQGQLPEKIVAWRDDFQRGPFVGAKIHGDFLDAKLIGYRERERDYDIDDCKLLGNIILTTHPCDLLDDTI